MKSVISLDAPVPMKGLPSSLSAEAQDALSKLREFVAKTRTEKAPRTYEVECSAWNAVFVTTNANIAIMLTAMSSDLHLFAALVVRSFKNQELNQLVLTYTKDKGNLAGMFITRIEERGQPKMNVFNVSPVVGH